MSIKQTFPDTEKLTECIAGRTALQEIIKEGLQAERKYSNSIQIYI